MEHIEGTAWAVKSQFLLKLSSISHSVNNCQESTYDKEILEFF